MFYLEVRKYKIYQNTEGVENYDQYEPCGLNGSFFKAIALVMQRNDPLYKKTHGSFHFVEGWPGSLFYAEK